MIISGLLLTLSEDPRLADRAEAAMRVRPEFMLGNRSQRWLPVALEAEDVGASRDLHDWLSTLPGVDYVDVVQVNFAGEAQLSPLGPVARQSSGALERRRPAKRWRTAAVQDADAPHERSDSISTVSTQEVPHEH